MKPRPTQSKQESVSNVTVVAATPERATPMVFVKSHELTRTGFGTHAEAVAVADSIMKPDRNGARDSATMRVRVSYRNRTGLYDVVVKLPVPAVRGKE